MNLFEMAQIPLNKAIEVMKLDPNAAAIIACPERTLEVSIPVKMDDGTTKVFTGYRSQHSTIMGPAKGGIRYHQSVNMDEVKNSGFLDDLQMRSCQSALRRRQRRHYC